MTGIAVRLWRLVGLASYFLYELVLSSLRVAWDVVTPQHTSRPGILAVPLDARSPLAITTFAQLTSLTPGSLSLEVTDDQEVLYVHVMFIDDADAERRAIKEGFERRVMEALE